MPSAPPDQHDALADARHNLARWQVIDAHWQRLHAPGAAGSG
jgi:hypothetical protein